MPNYMDQKQIKLMGEVLSNLLQDDTTVKKIMGVLTSNKAFLDVDKARALIQPKPDGTYVENMAATPFMGQQEEGGSPFSRVYLYTAIVFAYHYVLDCLAAQKTKYFDTYLLNTIRHYIHSSKPELFEDQDSLAETHFWHYLLPFYHDAAVVNNFITQIFSTVDPSTKNQKKGPEERCVLFPKVVAEGGETLLKDAILYDDKSFRQSRLENNRTVSEVNHMNMHLVTGLASSLAGSLDQELVWSLFQPLCYQALLADFQDRLFAGEIDLEQPEKRGDGTWFSESTDISNLLNSDESLRKDRWFITISVTETTELEKGKIELFKFTNPEPSLIDWPVKSKSFASKLRKKKYKAYDQAVAAQSLFKPFDVNTDLKNFPTEIQVRIHKQGDSAKLEKAATDGLTIKIPFCKEMYRPKKKAAVAPDEKADAVVVTENDRWTYFFAKCNAEIPELKNNTEAQTRFEFRLKEEFGWLDMEDDLDESANDSMVVDLLTDALENDLSDKDTERFYAVIVAAYANANKEDTFKPAMPNRFCPNSVDMPVGMYPTFVIYITLKKRYKNLTSLMQDFQGNTAKDILMPKDQPSKPGPFANDGTDEKSEQQDLVLDQTYASQCLEVLILYVVNYSDMSFSDKMYLILTLEKVKRAYNKFGLKASFS
jgi:hypothetical protein